MLKINKQRCHGFKCQYSDRQRSMLLRYTQVNASIVIKQQNKNPCLGKHCLNSKGVEIREYSEKKKRVWQVKMQIQSFMQHWWRHKTVATHQNNNSALQSLIFILFFVVVGATNCHIFNEEHLWFNCKALIKNACCILYLSNVWNVVQNSFLFNLKLLNSRSRKSCFYQV